MNLYFAIHTFLLCDKCITHILQVHIDYKCFEQKVLLYTCKNVQEKYKLVQVHTCSTYVCM